MYQIDIRLAYKDWERCGYMLERHDATLAYMSAIKTVKRRLQMESVDFIPLGSGEYLIWAQGKCQGYMGVKEVDPETNVG